MPTKDRDGYWMTAREVSVYLDLHMNTVKRIPPEKLPYMRVIDRGDRKYKRSDVEAYVRSRMVS